MTEHQNLMTRFLGRIPGVTEVEVADRETSCYLLRRDGPGGDECLIFRNPWSMDGIWTVRTLQVRGQMWLRPTAVLVFLRAWAAPGARGPERARELGRVAMQFPGVGGTAAQDWRTVSGFVCDQFTAACPQRADGRFVFADFTEPYPGCWPTAAVLAAECGDLSLLWPYLSCVGDA